MEQSYQPHLQWVHGHMVHLVPRLRKRSTGLAQPLPITVHVLYVVLAILHIQTATIHLPLDGYQPLLVHHCGLILAF